MLQDKRFLAVGLSLQWLHWAVCRRGHDGADLLLLPGEAPALQALLDDMEAQQ